MAANRQRPRCRGAVRRGGRDGPRQPMIDSEDPIHVLHVDDDPAFADLVATYLTREHDRIEVHTATDAAEGRAVLADRSIDCVVSDHDMSGEDGIEFLESVRRDHPELPFVLFTGKGSEAVASDAISAGVTDYLQKESGTEQYELLANRILNAVEARKSRRKLSERTRRLKTLIDNLPGLIYRCVNEPAWPMETVDGEVEALTGYPPEAIEGDGMEWGRDVIHPEDRETVWETVQEALERSGAFEITYRIVSKSGETKWVWERGRAVADDGSVAAIEGFITDVSDRKRREARLERTGARLEALFENSPDMINVHDEAGNILDANPQFCEETGYSEAELTSMKVWEIDTTLDPEEATAIWRGMAVGERLELEGEFRRRDGSTFPARVHVRQLNLDGEDRFVVNSRNVTERRTRERKLEQLRERTRALNYAQTVEETAQLASDAADEIIGAELSGVHLVDDDRTTLALVAAVDSLADIFDELPEYDRSAPPGTRSHLAWEALREGERIHLDRLSESDRVTEASPAESVVVHPIGDRGIFVISSPEPAAFDGTDLLVVEILANYLEAALDRVTREETLRARETRLERLHDATRRLIRADCREAIAEGVVAAAENILGFSIVVVRYYDSEENGLVPTASSDGIAEILPPREVFTPASGSLNWECFEAEEVGVYDDIRTEDAVDAGTDLRSLMILPIGDHGTIAVGETTPASFDATDEFLARILATAVETALDEQEWARELRESRDELKRQNDRLEEFAGVVSHDLRNPLTVAEGRLGLARGECDSEHLDAAGRALDRMGDLIEDLLTLTREGEAVTDRRPVDLGALAEDCWTNVDTADATLVAEADRTVSADRGRLKQVFENLVRNSVEHSSTGSRTRSGDGVKHGGAGVTVTVGTLADGFYVEDDGRGIPPDEREEVFDAGYSTSDRGTGFGLRIVADVVEAHGWTVDVTEGSDGGARFEVTGVEFVDG